MSIRNIQFAVDGETGTRKDNLGKGVTWLKVVEAGIAALEGASEEKEEAPEAPKYKFRIAPDDGVLVREFDILKDNQWRTVPVDDIQIGDSFRVRDDGRVLEFENFKRFVKYDDVLKDSNGYIFIPVEAYTK